MAATKQGVAQRVIAKAQTLVDQAPGYEALEYQRNGMELLHAELSAGARRKRKAESDKLLAICDDGSDILSEREQRFYLEGIYDLAVELGLDLEGEAE